MLSKMALIGGFGLGIAVAGGFLGSPEPQRGPLDGFARSSPKRKDKVVLSLAEWRRRLTPEQFEILRKQGTEPPFCGLLHDSKTPGTYYCAGCGLELFRSDAKFKSGTGWPSFFQPASRSAVWLRADRSHGMVREEVLCARCDGHLGHVFEDGPPPTGLRFCINEKALKFVPKKR